MAKLRLSSVVFCAKFTFTIKSLAMLNIAPAPGGFPKGDRDPTLAVAGEGSQGEGEIGTPSPCAILWYAISKQERIRF